MQCIKSPHLSFKSIKPQVKVQVQILQNKTIKRQEATQNLGRITCWEFIMNMNTKHRIEGLVSHGNPPSKGEFCLYYKILKMIGGFTWMNF